MTICSNDILNIQMHKYIKAELYLFLYLRKLTHSDKFNEILKTIDRKNISCLGVVLVNYQRLKRKLKTQ